MANRKPNWVLIAVVVLALVNLAVLTAIWTGRKRPPEPHSDARDFLIRELQLDAAQVRSFDSLRRLHFAVVDPLRENMQHQKEELFDQLQAPTDTVASGIAAAIGEAQTKIDWNTYQHFRALRALCRPGQQQRFDAVIQDVLRSMAPPGPGGPPPPKRD